MDKEYWNPGWKETPKEEWHIKQRNFLENEQWIVDGNYNGSLDLRMEKAEVVIFLDYNKYICLYRIIKRWIMYKGKIRSDMGEGCFEKIPDFEFIKFVYNFRKDSRPKIINKLNEYKNLKQIILKNQKEINLLIENLKKVNI